jgi:hypothetical protein
MSGKRKADPDQLVLGGTATRRRVGRHERAVDAAAKAARTANMVADWHVAGLSTARALARALDTAEREADGWLLAKLAAELRATLTALGWMPEGGNADDLADLVALFGGAEVQHPAQS